jgi:DNA-binding protein HU-beta
MTRDDIVAAIADKAEISKKAADVALRTALDEIMKGTKAGKISLVGFGTFVARERKARTARNPRTGAEVFVPATTVPKFSPGKAFKDFVSKQY